MKLRFFHITLSTEQASPSTLQAQESIYFRAAEDILHQAAQEVISYIANKFVYIDFNDVLFFNLYIGKGQDMTIMRY